MPAPEQQARETIDRLLTLAGWVVCDAGQAHITAHRGVAIREYPLKSGHGEAVGIIKAKKAGTTLIGVVIHSDKYTKRLHAGLPRWGIPLPFVYID